MLRTAGPLAFALLALLPLAALAQKRSGSAGSPSPLQTLISREWQYQLEHSPTYASVLGDRRWNGSWDDLSLEALEADHQHNLQVLRQLDALKRTRLSAKEQLDYELFRRDYATWVEEYGHRWFLLPVSHMSSLPEGVKQPPGVQVAYQLADTLRFTTVKDYEDWVQRLEGFGTYVDQVLALMRQGMAEKRLHPKVVLQRLPRQVEGQLVKEPTQSAFYGPFKRFPAAIPQAQQQRLAQEAQAAIARTVLPALERFHRFLVAEYIPAAPEHVGVWQLPEGEKLYAFLARQATTTQLTPEQIHDAGPLRGDADPRGDGGGEGAGGLQGQPRGVLPVPAHGPAVLLPERRRAAPALPRPRQAHRSRAGAPLRHAAAAALRRGAHARRRWRRTRPPASTIRPRGTARAPAPTWSTSTARRRGRAGRWCPSRCTRRCRATTSRSRSRRSRRACPSSAATATTWPSARAGRCTARGWATSWACTTDPYDKFGQLAYEMWRAVRLVVDTGMHAKGWTRAAGHRLLPGELAAPGAGRHQRGGPLHRDGPGQALAYKIGELKIRELRTRAEKALGARFDVRAFHDEVLLGGSLPLDVLERRIDAWIAGQAK